MATFNIKEVEVKDLDGNAIPLAGMGKVLGNTIYRLTSTIEWLEKAKLIHQELPVELSEFDLIELKSVVESPRCDFVLAVKAAIGEYIESLKK